MNTFKIILNFCVVIVTVLTLLINVYILCFTTNQLTNNQIYCGLFGLIICFNIFRNEND